MLRIGDYAIWRHAAWKARLAGAAVAFLAASAFVVGARHLTFSQSAVVNSERIDDLNVKFPRGFVQQSSDAPSLLRFRRHNASVVLSDKPQMERIVEIRHWVRNQQSDAPAVWQSLGETSDTDPEVLLRGQRSGLPGACRRFSYVLMGAFLSAGFQTRLASMGDSFLEGPNQHVMVEVWVDALNKWVLVDPTLDTMFLVDGQYASLVELRSALLRGERARIRFARQGSTRLPQPRVAIYAPMAQHAWFSNTNAIFDGYHVSLFGRRMTFVHLVDGFALAYPEGLKNVLLCAAFISIGLGIISLHRGASDFTSRTVAARDRAPVTVIAPAYSLVRRAQVRPRIPRRATRSTNRTSVASANTSRSNRSAEALRILDSRGVRAIDPPTPLNTTPTRIV